MKIIFFFKVFFLLTKCFYTKFGIKPFVTISSNRFHDRDEDVVDDSCFNGNFAANILFEFLLIISNSSSSFHSTC